MFGYKRTGCRGGASDETLSLTIDNQWTFRPHFEHLVPKVTAAANALCNLLLHKGISVGPGSECADYMRESFVPGSCEH